MTERAKTSADAPAAAGSAALPAADEFAHIPSPRTRHPLLAAAAAALAFFLAFHIRADVRYALSPTAAVDLGDARTAFSAAGLPAVAGVENRYVRVRGTPDRESALELDTKGSWVFSQFFRILGTGDRLYLHRRESPLPASRAERDVFEGRLIRFRDLSFQDSIRGYFRKHVTATHFFAPADLARAIAAHPGGPLALGDRAGDAVTVGPDDELALDVSRPDEVRVALSRAPFPDQAAARAALEQRGGEVVGALGLVQDAPRPGAPTEGPLSMLGAAAPAERWAFVVRFPPGKRDAALAGLEEADPKVAIRDARETLRARAGSLRADGDALVVEAAAGPPRRVPVSALAAARTVATVDIPGDAYLVIEADSPRDHLATLFMALVLAMFGAVNLMGLVRELRR
jgi:hypothetical protein